MDNKIDYLIGFIENKLDTLLQIYIKERCNKGDGILIIKGDKEKNNVDVGYVNMNMVNQELKKKIDELNYTNSKAYFFTFDISNPKINSLIEKELNVK